ncbi:hypothetical protein HU200_009699 [Digitaria exilis]|uniref:Uncharacterized protein n=1 Tax=Digitaria exilis TaxID=1010633 RepID=A0A835FIZ7_9POAL|nr:hypothetical protein HU200_009699 [Digitaria exilis]
MPGQRRPAATHLGGITSRRHAELLLHSGAGGVSVKDLRLHRVVPPAAGSLDTSPECAPPVKPGSVESTPPEAASAAAAAEDLNRKPVLPRSKLVRDPGSFGYRRLLPFLNEMAKNENELSRPDSRFVNEPLGDSLRESDAMDSVELTVLKTGGEPEVKDGNNNITEETNTVPNDLASSKLWLSRCTRSRLVHHSSSFSYKRMLPYLMENEISSQECERVKIRKVTEERLLASDENVVSASGQHAVSANSSQECNRAQVERMEEEEPPKADEKRVLDDRQPQLAVTKASPSEFNAAEAQNVLQQEDLPSNQNSLTSSEGDLTSDGDDVQASSQHQIVVSVDSPEECNGDEVKRTIQVERVKSDGRHVLDGREFQCCISEVSPKSSRTEVQMVTQEPLPLDGDEENSNKVVQLAHEQLQPCVTNESLSAQLQDNAEFTEVLQCQNKDSGCHDVGFVSPTKTVIPLLHRHCAQAPEDSVASHDDQFLDSDIQMICRPSDPCAVDRSLSVEEMSGCKLTEPGCKGGISQPRRTHSMEKRGLSPQKLSPQKLSPKKGILKRHTRGCKGICMCLDCCTFRLRADRAFEFSRKQMQEADDVINNLLKEVANLRSLVENPAGQQESTQAACRRASRVEDVARERCQQMFMDLNSHCKIPGPRVSFTQFVEEKKTAPSPRRSSRR